MKNLYNKENKQWDAYKAFYSHDGSPFVDFESGHTSLISNAHGPANIGHRQTYTSRAAAVVDTNGWGYRGKLIYKDPTTGATVPAAQLSYAGLATLLVDLDTMRAYDFYNANVILYPDGTVRTKRDVAYYVPRKLSPDENETLLQLVTMCKLLNKDNTTVPWWIQPQITDLTAPVDKLYNDLAAADRLAIAAGRYEIARLPTTVPYLNVEVK